MALTIGTTPAKPEIPWDRHEQAEMPDDDDVEHAFVTGKYVPVIWVDGKAVSKPLDSSR